MEGRGRGEALFPIKSHEADKESKKGKKNRNRGPVSGNYLAKRIRRLSRLLPSELISIRHIESSSYPSHCLEKSRGYD